MISCIIIDDEDVAREGMKLLIEQVNFLDLKGSFSNVMDADQFLKKNTVDLMFLDIHMPRLSGLEYLKQKQNHTRVILTTAYSDHAIEAFEYGAIDYLLKPIRFERFYKAVSKLETSFETKPTVNTTNEAADHFYIKHERKIVKLFYKEILFIEGLKDYSLIHTADQKIAAPMNLKTIEAQLPAPAFIRVSKSHIINTDHISSIETDLIYIKEQGITLSPLYKEEFIKQVVEKNYFKKNK